MAKSQSPWTSIALKPTGMLDTRSAPADLPPGSYRWRQNFGTNSTGQSARISGFSRFGTGNEDHHRQSATREVITFGLETQDGAGRRRLFDGSNHRVSLLDETAKTWTPILTGVGGDTARWVGAVSQGVLVLVDGIDADDVYAYDLVAGGVATPIAEVLALGIKGPRVVVEFEGFVVLMNLIDGANGRISSRVQWGDLNTPLTGWKPGFANSATGNASLANFQDLDYGDEIIAALPLLGSMIIYTRKAIWKMTVNADQTKVFSFERRYYEPENQKNCLVYPNTLVSDGARHIYASRRTICEYNPYITAPQQLDEGTTDWLHKATGVIFTDPLYKLSGLNCNIPVAKFVPSGDSDEDQQQGEYWISWTPGAGSLNSLTLVANTKFKTASVVDTGYTMFVNYRRNAEAGACNERQEFLGASSRDWAIKTMGNVFIREFAVTGADLTVDLALDVAYVSVGYNSVVRGLIPLGFTDREKHIRLVTLDQDADNQDVPCVAVLRLGSSEKLEDPNSLDDRRAPLWKTVTPNLTLASQNRKTLTQMAAQNLRPAYTSSWPTYRTGKFLYFELSITNADGSPAVGGASRWATLSFDANAIAK